MIMKNQKPRFSFKVFLNLKLWLCLFFGIGTLFNIVSCD
ncbi:putative membrane protein [Helicobacter pylori Hp P-62]|nr:putative membrane protein [Helicobacter pylori Hp P-62]